MASGCLIQWTAQFVADAASEDLVLRLAGEALFIYSAATPTPHTGGRPVRLAAGFARLATVCAPARIAWMSDLAPRAILRGDPVTRLP